MMFISYFFDSPLLLLLRIVAVEKLMIMLLNLNESVYYFFMCSTITYLVICAHFFHESFGGVKGS